MIKPYINNYLISAELEGGMPEIIGANGELLSFDKSFQPQEHACQYATVVETPSYFDEIHSRINPTLVQSGDKVFVSYDVIQKENQFFYEGKELYFCDWEVLIGVMFGNELVPTNDHFFVTFFEEQSGLLAYPEKRNVPQKVKVAVANSIVNSFGIFEGDTLLVVQGAGVPIKNTNLYYMRPVSVFGKEVDNKIVAIDGKGIVEEYDKDAVINPNKFYMGKLLDNSFGIKEGTEICFVHSSYTRLMYNGVRYSVIKKTNIIYKV